MRIFKIMLLTLLCIQSSYAANMCVKDDAVMVVLDPQIGGTALSNNATGKTWSTKFSYGVVSGIGGCYSAVGTTQGQVATNQVDITPYSSGTYCYCKMLRPISSPWVYSGYNGNLNYCASLCASYCSSYVGTVVAVRLGLFGNAGI